MERAAILMEPTMSQMLYLPYLQFYLPYPTKDTSCLSCSNRPALVIMPGVSQAALLHLGAMPSAVYGLQVCLFNCLRPGSGISLPFRATSEDKSHDPIYTPGLRNIGKHVDFWGALADSVTLHFKDEAGESQTGCVS